MLVSRISDKDDKLVRDVSPSQGLLQSTCFDLLDISFKRLT